MADTTIMEVDWDAMRATADHHEDGIVVRVNDAHHVVSTHPTAASWDGTKPPECTDGNWAVRREVVADDDGTTREVSHYHALRRLP
jgi:hypothetical protein